MISEHVSFKEGTFSATATRLGLPNAPSKEHLFNMQMIAKKIYDCKKYRVDMSQDPTLMAKHSIMAVPTVIVYHNGKEIKRFLPSLMMKLDVEIKDIQAVIDELVGDKF